MKFTKILLVLLSFFLILSLVSCARQDSEIQEADKMEKESDSHHEANEARAALRRKLKARAFDVQVDAAGRIMLPAEQRSAVGIDRDVVIVGNTGYFEVWDAKRYVAADEQVDLSLLFS